MAWNSTCVSPYLADWETGYPKHSKKASRAARLFFESDNLRRLDVSADQIAAIIVGQVQPSVIQIDDLVQHMTRAQWPMS